MQAAPNVKKATITNEATGEVITVLFNPNEYMMERSVNYSEVNVPGLDIPILQFINGTSDILIMNLFFDTYSSGGTADKAEAQKKDVSGNTKSIYRLMNVHGDTHAPPLVTFEWGSLKFKGYVISVKQKFVKFTYEGNPVRATLEVTFRAFQDVASQLKFAPRNSPDRTKFRVVKQGDTLAGIAAIEYGDFEEWRRIADYNGIENPRLLNTGQILAIPAIV